MEQQFMHIMAGDAEATLAAELTSAGFKVAPSGRMSGGIHVRVRVGTADEATVQRITDRVAPSATFGPSGSPTTHLEGYRSGL
jgi:hypothetical protein